MALTLLKLGFSLHVLHALPPHKSKATSTPCAVTALSIIKIALAPCLPPELEINLAWPNGSMPERKKTQETTNTIKKTLAMHQKVRFSYYLRCLLQRLAWTKIKRRWHAKVQDKGQHKPQRSPRWFNMSPIWCQRGPKRLNIAQFGPTWAGPTLPDITQHRHMLAHDRLKRMQQQSILLNMSLR